MKRKTKLRKKTFATGGGHRSQPIFRSDRLQEIFIKSWKGTVRDTVEVMAKMGCPVSERTGNEYLKKEKVISGIRVEMDRRLKPHIANKEELQVWFNQVMRGEIADGVELVPQLELIHYCDDDYKTELFPQRQYRTIYVKEPRPPKMTDRLKAAELHGKSIMAFVQPVEITGGLTLSIANLLDDDIKPVIQLDQNGKAIAAINGQNETLALGQGDSMQGAIGQGIRQGDSNVYLVDRESAATRRGASPLPTSSRGEEVSSGDASPTPPRQISKNFQNPPKADDITDIEDIMSGDPTLSSLPENSLKTKDAAEVDFL